MEDNSKTIAEVVANRADTFPADHDHHPLNSFAVGWNLGRLQGRIFGQLMQSQLSVEEVVDSLYHSEMISYDSAQNFNITNSIDDTIREIRAQYGNPEEIVDDEHLELLIENIDEWSEEYSSEIGDMDVVSIVDKGLIDTREVFRRPESIFDDSVWNWLDQQPRQDISHSCKTLVLDMPTASSFLSLRAVEYCLREWYREQTGKNIDKSAWGEVTRKIESEFDANEKAPVLSNLEYLREKRNGIAHPDVSPSWQEAEDILFNVRRTITEIHSELS